MTDEKQEQTPTEPDAGESSGEAVAQQADGQETTRQAPKPKTDPAPKAKAQAKGAGTQGRTTAESAGPARPQPGKPAKAKPSPTAAAEAAKAPEAKKDVSRRDFLRIGLFATAALFLLQIGGAFGNYFWPRRTGAFGGKVDLGHYSQFPPNTVTRVEPAKLYLAHHPRDGLLAIFWTCTHLGCTVPWKPEAHATLNPPGCFCCPCHGSEFSFTGEYLAGPAPRSLDLFPIEIDENGHVIVDTGQTIERTRYSPQQATPIPS